MFTKIAALCLDNKHALGFYTENAVNAYTYGLRNFDKLELEVCDLNTKELFFCIYDIVLHILTYYINLKDEDILKFEDEKEIKFTKSQCISVENESLKIIFYVSHSLHSFGLNFR